MDRHRKSIRLKNYDYSQNGGYFVTICSKDRRPCFGQIVNEKIDLSSIGEIVERCWLEIPKHFLNVQLDEWVIMPNHIHVIIIINTVGTDYNLSKPRTEYILSLQNNGKKSIPSLQTLNIYINKDQYFEGVPKEVWEYRIGAYQVMEKYLKDRKGRKLSLKEINHYMKVAKAIQLTIELQKEIDKVYAPSNPALL